MKRIFRYCLPLLICLVVSCKKGKEPGSETLPLSELNSTSVRCNGTASGDKITERGFCWNTLGEPTVNNNTIKDDGGSGSYSLLLDGLKSNAQYYVRAYCKTKTDIAYGNTVSFTSPDQPSTHTNPYTNLTINSFSTSGSVDTKGKPLLSAGICWGSGANPDISNSKVVATVINNNFSCNITGLDSNTTYYYRSYATFAEGTIYGEPKPVKTFAGRVKDIDGNVYYTVDIGGIIWTTSNLKTTRYRNGNAISYYSNTTWYNIPAYTGAYGRYNNTTVNTAFGCLYNFFAIQDTRGLAPTGWHIPTNADWQALENTLGTTAALEMKAYGSTYWNDNAGSKNSSGFSAVGAGYRNIAGTDAGYLDEAHFWSSTVSSTSGSDIIVYGRTLYGSSASMQEAFYDGGNGLSIRCVKD
jgi:uncharacterized protein (TIGR02145 family)